MFGEALRMIFSQSLFSRLFPFPDTYGNIGNESSNPNDSPAIPFPHPKDEKNALDNIFSVTLLTSRQRILNSKEPVMFIVVLGG